MIRCGHCKNQHETVAEVRNCSGVQHAATASDGITTKQLDFLNKLRVERGLGALPADVKLSKKDASAAISDHLNTPTTHPILPAMTIRKAYDNTTPASGIPDVPAGHYAVTSLTGNNDLDFFRVDRPTEGRWAGRTFVHRIIGGKADSPVRGKTAKDALVAIAAAGPDAAGFLYGQELGRCRRCNRHLTDELSRSLSIGPDCRSKAA
jgi:hypothetical protein